MKLAITHPTTFDRVRRGTERFAHELAVYMTRRGHDVTVIACKPGPGEKTRRHGYLQDSHRRWWIPAFGRAGILEAHTFLPSCFTALVKQRFDIVQSCGFTDAYAAQLAGRITGTPTVFFVNAIPPPVKYYRSVSLGGGVFHRAINGADEIIVLSQYVNDFCERRFGRRGIELPVPVDTDLFSPQPVAQNGRQYIACTAALDDRRKGGRVLMRAFNLVRQQAPLLELDICCPLPDDLRKELISLVQPEHRAAVNFRGEGEAGDLPDIYSGACATVLPSLWEAFGLVVIESMACGTPVAGSRDGALPETICNDGVGRLFDPGGGSESPEASNYAGLAQAIIETLELARRPQTADVCRDHALQYGWHALGPRYEALYREVIEQRQGGEKH